MYDSFDLRQCCYPLATYTAPNRHPLQDFESFIPGFSGSHSLDFLISAMFDNLSQKLIPWNFFGLQTHSYRSIWAKKLNYGLIWEQKFFPVDMGSSSLCIAHPKCFLWLLHKMHGVEFGISPDIPANISLRLIIHRCRAVKRSLWTSFAISGADRQASLSLFLQSSRAGVVFYRVYDPDGYNSLQVL